MKIGAKRLRALSELERALDDWTRRGNEQPLTRWLNRELDPRGVPIHLPISRLARLPRERS